jgi:NAD(P)-dependent dehydrogenase (short-subunit alcohol dehydrogenase family)
MAEIRFDGQVAVVTGSGAGLGRTYALELARRGAAVVVNDLRPDAADSAVAEIGAAGGKAVANYDSVTAVQGGAAIISAAISNYGRVDILINNAGFLRDRSFGKLTSAEIDDVLDVHLRGAFRVTQPAFAVMKEQQYGRIVLTTSSVGLFGNFGQTNYAAAKMGLVGLARALAVEGARAGIKVNVVAPSAATGMTQGIFGQHAERFRPEQVTPMSVFLASKECPGTGQIFWAGGGRFARVAITQTAGWVADGGDVTPEDIRDHLDAITDPAMAFTPVDAMDELATITQMLGVELGVIPS